MQQSKVHVTRRPSMNPVGWLLAVAAVAGLFLGWWSYSREGQAPADAAPQPAATASLWSRAGQPTTDMADRMRDEARAAGVFQLTSSQAEQQLTDAAKAAGEQIGQPPITGPVTQRPAFVSELEWTALQQAAAQRPDSERELTRMVNHLRFMKQLDLWSRLSTQADAAKRRTLAAALLDELPARVGNGEMARSDAQRLQATLLEDLVADPGERARRLEAEGRRLPGTTATGGKPASGSV